MNTERQIERKVICSVERAYGSSERDVGKLRAFFEILPTNEVVPINSTENFCETERVFVTGQFSELKEKFGDKLFEVICIPSNVETREGDCRYVTRMTSCTDIKGLQCCQVFDHQLPDASQPELVIDIKPSTKTILLRHDELLYGPFEFICEADDESSNFRLKISAISTPLNNTPQYHIGSIAFRT